MRSLLETSAKKARDELQRQDKFILDLDFFELLYTKRLKKYFNMFFNYGL